MFNIHSVMLALLGLLVANLLVLLLAPAYWRRAVRLTTLRLKQEMPLTEAEIRADKDRLRAEYAIKVHRLEVKGEQAAYDQARQQIELNRRDAVISQLESEIGRMKTSLEEHENARRVLEQTITDRFPRVEQRLAETTRTLSQRERDLASITETATRQAKALEEAGQLTAQQRDDVMRLNNTLAALSARTREGLNDPRLASEVALRSEIETLRGKLQQQASLIEQLQAGAGGQAQPGTNSGSRGAAAALLSLPPVDSSEAERMLALARTEAETALRAKAEIELQLAAVRRTLEDQTVEIAALKASLTTYEGGGDERSMSLKDTRIAMRARIGALQAESQHQSAAIQRMRSELAAANEKLAKQAQHFMAELRRLGPGGNGAAAHAKAAADGRRALHIEAAAPQARRMGPKLSDLAKPLRSVAGAAAEVARTGVADLAGESQDPSRVRGFLKALGGAAAVRAGADAKAAEVRADGGRSAAATAEPRPAPDRVAATVGAEATREGEADAGVAARPRRLVDRISNASKS